MLNSTNQLIQLRDEGMHKLQLGQKQFNDTSNFEVKSEALRTYITGLDLIMKYAKQEPDQEYKSKVKKNIEQYMVLAESMKNQVNTLGKFQSQMPVKQSIQQSQSNDNINKMFSFFQLQPDLKNNNQSVNNNVQKKQIIQQQQKQNNNNNEANKQEINNMIVQQDKQNEVKWDDIAGLKAAKDALKEAVIIPIKFPSLFTGVRTPWKGILLYGPPGTGKTYLARACATECKATFFSVSSADLISKFVGDSERMVKQLFNQARQQQPSIIFIDEIDSLVASREGSGEKSEASSRVKTQFLVEMQGVNGSANDGVLVLGATNLPWTLDPAIRRRFEKRIYIPLPDQDARQSLLENSLKKTPHNLKSKDIKSIAKKTEMFSGADLSILVRDACYQPVRLLQKATKFKKVKDKQGNEKYTPCSEKDKKGIEMNFMSLKDDQLLLPEMTMKDFEQVLSKVKPSVGNNDITQHQQFTAQFGEEG